MKTIIEQTYEALDKARKMVTAAIDVADLPDNHRDSKRVTSAFIGLEEVLEELPRSGRNAKALYDNGPAVFVTPGDMRFWKTTDGKTAAEQVMPQSRFASRFARAFGKLTASKKIATRRVVLAKEYLEGLEEATVKDEPVCRRLFHAMNDSYTLASITHS